MEIIENMPYAEYAKRPGVNGSLLKLIHRKSLLHARAYLDGEFSEESDELDFGKCFHSLALEDREDFVSIPATYTNDKEEVKAWNWNANACKAWRKDQGDKIPLSDSATKAVRRMSETVVRELAGDRKGRTELSLFAEMKGVPVKCRIDLLPDDPSSPIYDLKSCKSGEFEPFMRSAYKLGYHLQAAFTLDVAKACGIDRKGFAILAVESEVPHGSCLIDFSDEVISYVRVGRMQYRVAFLRLIEAQSTNRWPGYGSHAAEEYTPVYLKEVFEQAT